MPDEFKSWYVRSRWLRVLSWFVLCLGIILSLLINEGFPLRSWSNLISFLLMWPDLWHRQGMTSLGQLLILLCMALFWSVIWYCLGYALYCLVRYHRGFFRLRMLARGMTWTPSSLAFSQIPSTSVAPVGVLENIPRLRLPQRVGTNGDRSRSEYLDTRSSNKEETRGAIAELPTRPAAGTGKMRSALPLEAGEARVHLARPAYPLSVGIGWDPGLLRRESPNQDSVAAVQAMCSYQNRLLPYALFVVADGMGGHANGQKASQIAIQSMTHTVLQNIIMMGQIPSSAFFSDILVGGVEWANLAIYHQGQADRSDMGTTLTAALFIDQKAYIVNVGDCRTYLYRASEGLKQITRDHSVVASLLAFGQITRDELYTHPERGTVYRSVGQSETLKVDLFVVDVQPQDSFLLCSDGLWEMVRDPTIERIMRACPDPLAASDRLVQTALRGGGVDNISAIVVSVP